MKEISKKTQNTAMSILSDTRQNMREYGTDWTWASFGIARYSRNCIKDMRRFFEEKQSRNEWAIRYDERHGKTATDRQLEEREALNICIKTMDNWLKVKEVSY